MIKTWPRCNPDEGTCKGGNELLKRGHHSVKHGHDVTKMREQWHKGTISSHKAFLFFVCKDKSQIAMFYNQWASCIKLNSYRFSWKLFTGACTQWICYWGNRSYPSYAQNLRTRRLTNVNLGSIGNALRHCRVSFACVFSYIHTSFKFCAATSFHINGIK